MGTGAHYRAPQGLGVKGPWSFGDQGSVAATWCSRSPAGSKPGHGLSRQRLAAPDMRLGSAGPGGAREHEERGAAPLNGQPLDHRRV